MYKDLLIFLPELLRKKMEANGIQTESLEEIRMRCRLPVQVIAGGRETWLLDEKGQPWILSEDNFRKILEKLFHASPYAHEEELKQGYFTVEGGHRIGVGGTILMDKGEILSISPIRSLNIRIAHEIKGCANRILECFRTHGIGHTLIVSPPGMGKTTLLRDLVRQVSNFLEGKSVALIDERKEIAGCIKGIPQYDVGQRTDILDNCPKTAGMLMAIRALAPYVLAVDEIGGKEDVEALGYASCCGCKLFATIHGNGISELKQKPYISDLLEEHYFRWFVQIKGKGDYEIREVSQTVPWCG
jgi:stage III sporulation protein AA